MASVGAILNQRTRETAPKAPPVPEEIMLEAEMTTDTGFAADRTVDLEHQAALICTEYGGPLWENAGRTASAV